VWRRQWRLDVAVAACTGTILARKHWLLVTLEYIEAKRCARRYARGGTVSRGFVWERSRNFMRRVVRNSCAVVTVRARLDGLVKPGGRTCLRECAYRMNTACLAPGSARRPAFHEGLLIARRIEDRLCKAPNGRDHGGEVRLRTEDLVLAQEGMPSTRGNRARGKGFRQSLKRRRWNEPTTSGECAPYRLDQR